MICCATKSAHSIGWLPYNSSFFCSSWARQKTQDIVRKRIPEAILVKPADFDKVYDAFIAELNKECAEKMEKEYTELVKERVSLITGKDV